MPLQSEQYLKSAPRRYQIAPIKKPALLRGRVLRNSNTSSSALVLDSHQRLSDVADNTVCNRQVISSYTNQVDYGSAWRSSDVAVSVNNVASSSAAESFGFDHNLCASGTFNEEHFQSVVVASAQSARVESVASTQHDCIAYTKVGSSRAADGEVCTVDLATEVENIRLSSCQCESATCCKPGPGSVRQQHFVSVGRFECFQSSVSYCGAGVQRCELVYNCLSNNYSCISSISFDQRIVCSNNSFSSGSVSSDITSFSGRYSTVCIDQGLFFSNGVDCRCSNSAQLLKLSDQSGFLRACNTVQLIFQSRSVNSFAEGSSELGVASRSTSCTQCSIGSGQRNCCSSTCRFSCCLYSSFSNNYVSCYYRWGIASLTNSARCRNASDSCFSGHSSSVANQYFLSSYSCIISTDFCSQAASYSNALSVRQVAVRSGQVGRESCSGFAGYGVTSSLRDFLSVARFVGCYQRVLSVAEAQCAVVSISYAIKSRVGAEASFLQVGNSGVSSSYSVDQRNAWNQTWQGACRDAGQCGVDRSSGTVNVGDNRSSSSAEVGADSVNPSTVKAKKAIFKGLKDI